MNNKFEKFFYFKSLDLKIPEHISKKFLKDINKILFLSNLDLNSIKSNLKINFENEKLIFTYADLIEIGFIKFEKKDENIFIDLIANINAENEDIIKYELELEHQFLNHKNLGLNKIEGLGEFMLEIFIDIISFNGYKNINMFVLNPKLAEIFKKLKTKSKIKDFKNTENTILDSGIIANNYILNL